MIFNQSDRLKWRSDLNRMNNMNIKNGGIPNVETCISPRTQELIKILKEFNEINGKYADWLAEEYEDEKIINEAANKFAEFTSSIDEHLKRRIIGTLSENNFSKL